MSDARLHSAKENVRGVLLAESMKNAHGRLCVLIDPILVDPLRDAPTRAEAIVLPLRRRDLKDEQRPYLLALGDFGRDQAIESSIGVAISEAMHLDDSAPRARSVCGWIRSGSPKELASHMAGCAALTLQGESRMLRHWDPRIMDILAALVNPTQRQCLLRHATARYWLRRDGAIQSIVLDQAAAEPEAASALRLDDGQLDLLVQAGYVNRALDVLQEMGHDMAALSPAKLARNLRAGMQSWRLDTERDRVMYLVYVAMVGEGFDRTPEVHARMLAAQASGSSVMDALDAFDDAYWQSLGSTTLAHTAVEPVR